MRHAGQILAVGALLVAAAVSVCADEIRLKDGTKINGVIVGFEDNSFRVKTSFGYALVQKDQVVSIVVADADKKLDAEAKPEAAGDKSAAAAPANASKAESTTASAASGSNGSTSSPAANSAATQPAASATTAKLAAPYSPNTTAKASAPKPDSATSKPAMANATAPVPGTGSGAKNTAPTVAGAAPAVAQAAKAADSESMREEVSGNTYTNRTWGFQMYKPPDWQVIEGARSMLPGAITAMGTSDQKTYLLIGQEAAGKSLATDMDAIEGRLREALENYRPLGEKRVTVSGVTAIQHKFRGSIDNHDWSGIVVFIPRDTHLYTIFGMTYADSDLVQIQENVISRAISSLQFTTKQ